LVMAQRPYRLLGSPETRSLIFLIKNSPDQAEGYLDYLQPLPQKTRKQDHRSYKSHIRALFMRLSMFCDFTKHVSRHHILGLPMTGCLK
jgi:hypothetical protein